MPTREVYKHVGRQELGAEVYYPEGEGTGSAIVFFHGGGWRSGSPAQFHEHCLRLSALGMVAVSAEYRLLEHADRPAADPFECVADAKSAVRWLRSRAPELEVDPQRIAAGGGSAGGHVAAVAGVIEGHDEEGEDLSISSRPDALVLFNPVIDTTTMGWAPAPRLLGERAAELSPAHRVTPGDPPTLVFHGTEDGTVPIENADRFSRLMGEAGNVCQLVPFEGETHGFFNVGRGDGSAFTRTLAMTETFLGEQGFLTEAK